MHRTIRSAAIVIVTTIVTAGISRGAGLANAVARADPAQTKAAAPAAGDACSLLTKQDAVAALGEPVGGPKSTRVTDTSSCESTGSGLHKVQLTLMSMPPDQAAIYRGLCAQKGMEGLSGLGDVACW